MNAHTLRRTAAAGLALVAIVSTSGCARHLGAQPVPAQGGQQAVTNPAPTGVGTVPSPATSQPAGPAQAAAAALGTAIDNAGAAASTQSSDLTQSKGSAEGDPTQ